MCEAKLSPPSTTGRVWVIALSLLLATWLSACGGGGGTSEAAPTAISYGSSKAAVVGEPYAIQPAVTGRVTSWSISPALPTGLLFDSSNGRISGTPTQTASPTDYTITASNDGGSTRLTLQIKVSGLEGTPGPLSRDVVRGTSVTLQTAIKLLHTNLSLPVYAVIDGPAGPMKVDATATVSGDGRMVLSLETSPSASTGAYAGDLTIALCRDAACTARQEVPSVRVAYRVRVQDSSSAWPGNNPSTLTPLGGAPDWSTFQGNAAHTGHVPVSVDPNRFSPRWVFASTQAGTGHTGEAANLATSDGRLFLAVSNSLEARSEVDGRLLWRYDFSGLTYPSSNPPAVKDGVVYVAAGQQGSTFMHAFAAGTGELRFKSVMSSQWENYLAPTVGGQGVYTNAGTYGGLYGFDLAGNQRFFVPLDQTSKWSAAVDETGVYTYTGSALTVVHPTTGEVLHRIPDPNFELFIYEINGSPVLGSPGSVFAAQYGNSVLNGGAIGNTLINFRLKDNRVAWKVRGVYPATPAFHAATLYAVNNNPLRLEALSESDGQLIWSWTPPNASDTRFVSEVLLTDNLAFVSTNASTYAIDRQSRRAVWSWPRSGKLALSAQGVLYIQGTSELTAINLN